MRIHLPHGGRLPAPEFASRHRFLVALLWLSAFSLQIYSALGGYGLAHGPLHSLPLVALAVLASMRSLNHRLRSAFCALGLLTAAALSVHAAHGVTEAHFAFFVLVVALTLYEDWLPFLLAVAFVLLHHGVFGMLAPEAVFSGVSLNGSPWKWAVIHAVFIAGAGAAAVVVWSANEKLREEKEHLIARLSALSHQDQLTGVANRRAWDERFTEEIERARRSGGALSLALLDLDDLKGVNDGLGHQAGDRLLRTAAAAWARGMRETDFLARLGGDEFGILLPGCDAAQGGVIVQRLIDETPGSSSVSAGIATWDRAETADALVKRADTALYAAKGAGGGRLAAV